MLNKTTEGAHAAVRTVIFRLISALQISDKDQLKFRSVATFKRSLKSPMTFIDEIDVHMHNLTLLKPAVSLRQVHALRFTMKRLALVAKQSQNCVFSCANATSLVRLLGEARFKIALLEELYKSYQSVHEQENPEFRYLRRNSTTSVFAGRDKSENATKKQKLEYLQKLVRHNKGNQRWMTEIHFGNQSFSSQSLVEKQKKTAEKALERGIFDSKNIVLASAVRAIFFEKEKLNNSRLYYTHNSL